MAQKVIINNTVITSSSSAGVDVTGDVVSCAFDFVHNLFWFTTQAMRNQYGQNAWNNSSTANPSTGVGGLSMGALTPGAYFPAFGDLEGNSACTINAGSSGFLIPQPTGFTAWGGTGASQAVPGTPTSLVSGKATTVSVPLSWNAAVTGGAATSYQVQYALTGSTVFYNGPISTTTNCVVSGLIPNTSYKFQVFASNMAGNSAASSTVSATTTTATNAYIPYRGLNIEGGNLSAISGLATTFPNANAVIIPVFCSTASQTSTDVVLTTTVATITAWVQAATSAGFDVFLGIYLNPRDGSPRQTITPGPSFAAVQTFMTNLSAVCQQAAQIGAQNSCVGMFCGVELQPWAGTAAGDTGPFSATNVALWQSIYTACKTAWPSGIISYAALQTSLYFTNLTSSFSVDWSFWDAIAIDLYPGSNNTYNTVSQFQTFFQNNADPDANTVASVGTTPLIQALVNYSNSVGRPLMIVQCGIIPADGNQTLPGQATVIPPPYDYTMQAAWWQAVLNVVSASYGNFQAFFAWDAGVNGYSSPYSGIDYWGIQSTASAAVVNTSYSQLLGVTSSLVAPTNVTASTITPFTILVSWTAIPGTGITYVVQYAVFGTSTYTSLAATSNTSLTISNLTPTTEYQIKVYGIQGTTIGPTSAVINATTTAVSGTQTITINSFGTINANTSFVVTGNLSGFATAPTLTYVDDPSLSAVSGITDTVTPNSITLNWNAVTGISQNPLPSGSIVSPTSFSFTHPGLAAGNHVLEITNNTVIASLTYTIA